MRKSQTKSGSSLMSMMDKQEVGIRIKNNFCFTKTKEKPNIRVRLLMTTGCVEYWFLLHYKKICPSIQNVAEKENVMKMLLNECPGYTKGIQL